MNIIQERLDEVMTLNLLKGSHEVGKEMCAMEAAAYIAGENWTDSPECVCPVISQFMRSWNDGLPSNEDRDRLLKPLLPKVIGTRNKALEERRSYMALDWLIRVHTPRFLDLTDSLKTHAKALRDLDKITNLAGATAAGKLTRAAWAAARDVARDVARDAAGDAARAAAGDAARAAARAAAWDAAWDAAGAAAGAAARAAAWAAARAAAWAAAGDAAGDALTPTVEWFQSSASDLVIRMSELK